MASNSKSSDGNGKPCGKSNCSKLVSVQGIQCDFCKLWFHLSCTELNEKAYNFLSETKFKSIIWKCASCPSLKSILKNDISLKLSEFQESFSKKIDNIETNIAKKINLAYKVREPAPSGKTADDKSSQDSSVTVVPQDDTTQIIKSKQKEIQTPLADISEGVDNGAVLSTQICGFYKKGVCRHGASGKKMVNNAVCEFLHPPKCRKYCRFGRDGCEGGCGMLHPILCKSSVKFGECHDERCFLQHLFGTRRHINATHNNSRANDVYNGKHINRFSHNPGRSFQNQNCRGVAESRTCSVVC